MPMPEPDVLVARRDQRRYADWHPTPRDAFLVIEVADSSLRIDKDVKVPLYAAAGIPEAWIVDLNAERIEVLWQVCRAARSNALKQSGRSRRPNDESEATVGAP